MDRTLPETGHCECVIWREGSRRCELWTDGNASRLRVFEGQRLIADEPFLRGAGWIQAQALRIWTPERRTPFYRLLEQPKNRTEC